MILSSRGCAIHCILLSTLLTDIVPLLQELHFTEIETGTSESAQLEKYKDGFKQLHPQTAMKMYFM